jgi:DNA-binding transcriptional regulator LsrR (DeoR family)
MLADSQTIGVGWGWTIYQSSLYLKKAKKGSSLTFVPLVGISGETNPYLQNNVIVDRFAEKFVASSYYTSVPVFRNNSDIIPQLEKDRYARLKNQWEKMDTAIVGLGAPFSSGDFIISEASNEYKELITRSAVVGDILAHFFYPNGDILDSSEYYDQISFSLTELSKLPKVICPAGGKGKISGIITASKYKYIKSLITDSCTARAVLESA